MASRPFRCQTAPSSGKCPCHVLFFLLCGPPTSKQRYGLHSLSLRRSVYPRGVNFICGGKVTATFGNGYDCHHHLFKVQFKMLQAQVWPYCKRSGLRCDYELSVCLSDCEIIFRYLWLISEIIKRPGPQEHFVLDGVSIPKRAEEFGR